MYHLLVADFDQTLLDSDEAIPLSTMVEIDRIRKNGTLFAVATGRILRSVLEYNRDFPFLDYVVACNGAYVYDVSKGVAIFKKSVGATIIRKIKKMYGDCDIYFCTTMDWNLCQRDIVFSEFLGTRQTYSSFYDKYKDEIYKMEVHFKTKKERDNAYNELEELKVKATYNKQMYGKKDYLIEITAFGIHKKTGIEKICKQEKIKLAEVVAIGDSDNDISMISACGVGVAVSNATKDLKRIADLKTTSNETKGVERVIKKLF